MNELKIARTDAIRSFRKRLSHPVKNLNTLIVGLAPIRAGTVLEPPSGLAVRWEVGDPVRTTDEARGSAITALMINACDALDQYLAALGEEPSPVKGVRERSFLRGEPRSPQTPPPKPTLAELGKLILLLDADPLGARGLFGKFADIHYGKMIKATSRRRFDEICLIVGQTSVNSQAPPQPRASYVAAVHLLVCWRNVQVHEVSHDTLSLENRLALMADASFLKQNHAGVDIGITLNNYDRRSPPTLKDVSTLVSILLRTVQAIDELLIYDADLDDLLRQAVWKTVRKIPVQERIKYIKGLVAANFTGRVTKLKPMWERAGFIPTSFEVKKDAKAVRILQLSKTFVATDKALDFLQEEEYLNAQ